MKEKIYTIPVMDVFKEDCECPLCLLEKKMESDCIEYILGPSLMEPDRRMETNEKGFCRRHFELLYNRQENRLGLGLIIDTYLCEQNSRIKKVYDNGKSALKRDSGTSFIKSITGRMSSNQAETFKLVDEMLSVLTDIHDKCTICSKLDYTMDRYTDVILYLWFEEQDFRNIFSSKKGFCLKHLKLLLEGTKKYLSPKKASVFIENLFEMQIRNMERIQQEVNWFTKKFDYRNNDAPWGNSKDAVPRSIQKIAGYNNLSKA